MTARAMFGIVSGGLVGLLLAVLIGLSLLPKIAPGVALSQWTAPAGSTRVPPMDAVGAVGHLPPVEGFPHTVVWVEETGLSAWNRAYDNRDNAGMLRVMETYETLEVPHTSTVRIVNKRGAAIQIELLDGPLQGRRGWLPATALVIS